MVGDCLRVEDNEVYDMEISGNQSLAALAGFGGVREANAITINGNGILSLTGLGGLKQAAYVRVLNNPTPRSLTGLSSLQAVVRWTDAGCELRPRESAGVMTVPPALVRQGM